MFIGVQWGHLKHSDGIFSPFFLAGFCVELIMCVKFVCLTMTSDPLCVSLDTNSPAGPEEDEHTASNDSSSYLPDKVSKHSF